MYKIISGILVPPIKTCFIGSHEKCRQWIKDKSFDYQILRFLSLKQLQKTK